MSEVEYDLVMSLSNPGSPIMTQRIDLLQSQQSSSQVLKVSLRELRSNQQQQSQFQQIMSTMIPQQMLKVNGTAPSGVKKFEMLTLDRLLSVSNPILHDSTMAYKQQSNVNEQAQVRVSTRRRVQSRWGEFILNTIPPEEQERLAEEHQKQNFFLSQSIIERNEQASMRKKLAQQTQILETTQLYQQLQSEQQSRKLRQASNIDIISTNRYNAQPTTSSYNDHDSYAPVSLAVEQKQIRKQLNDDDICENQLDRTSDDYAKKSGRKSAYRSKQSSKKQQQEFSSEKPVSKDHILNSEAAKDQNSVVQLKEPVQVENIMQDDLKQSLSKEMNDTNQNQDSKLKSKHKSKKSQKANDSQQQQNQFLTDVVSASTMQEKEEIVVKEPDKQESDVELSSQEEKTDKKGETKKNKKSKKTKTQNQPTEPKEEAPKEEPKAATSDKLSKKNKKQSKQVNDDDCSIDL